MLVKKKRNYLCYSGDHKDDIIDWKRCREYARRQFNHIRDKERPEWSTFQIADLALFRMARKFRLNSEDVRRSPRKNFLYLDFGHPHALTICYARWLDRFIICSFEELEGERSIEEILNV